MKCNNKYIKEMLPAYLEEGLEPDEKLRMKSHLKACEDCRAELALLRMMAEEPVPDPGGAFWQTMPERVFRSVQEEKKRRKGSILSARPDSPFLSRWAWATAAVGLAAVVSWLLVRPAPIRNIVSPELPANGISFEDIVSLEPISVAELSSTELNAATQWAQNELAPMREAVTQDAPGDAPKDVYEDLMELSREELDRVYEMLKTREREMKEKHRKKTEKEKDLG